jgi:acetyl-CoA acetyltransferase
VNAQTAPQAVGLTFPGVFALIARAHMDKHGTTEEQMAHVAVKNHRHGALKARVLRRLRSPAHEYEAPQ